MSGTTFMLRRRGCDPSSILTPDTVPPLILPHLTECIAGRSSSLSNTSPNRGLLLGSGQSSWSCINQNFEALSVGHVLKNSPTRPLVRQNLAIHSWQPIFHPYFWCCPKWGSTIALHVSHFSLHANKNTAVN